MEHTPTETYILVKIDAAKASVDRLLNAYNLLLDQFDENESTPVGSLEWKKAKAYSFLLRDLMAARPDVVERRKSLTDDAARLADICINQAMRP